jgi:hypothetical protein
MRTAVRLLSLGMLLLGTTALAQDPAMPPPTETAPTDAAPPPETAPAPEAPPAPEPAPAPAAEAPASTGYLLKPAAFVFQPGFVTGNALSSPPGSRGSTDFLMRLVTVIPTASDWVSLVAGLAITPANDNNHPAFFYGLAIPLAPVSDMTDGWVSVALAPLGVYGRNLGGASGGAYGTALLLELACFLNVGAKLSGGSGPLSGVSLFLLADQLLTSTNDLFNPSILYGVSITVAPWES